MSFAKGQRSSRKWRFSALVGVGVLLAGMVVDGRIQQGRAAQALRDAGYREFITRASGSWRCPWGSRTTDFVNHHGEPTKGYVCTSYFGAPRIHALPAAEPLNIDDH